MVAQSVFSWGYWGWGGATERFVEAADAVENARGFAPPVFVDARISRAVRAQGFRGAAFEQLLGPERYRWLPGLGNQALGRGMELANAEEAEKLLELAFALGAERRRVVFFCACEFRRRDSRPACHRDLVASELVERAARRAKQVSVVEWPGSGLAAAPRVLNVAASVVRAVASGRKSVDVGEVPLVDAASLAWGSPVWFACESARVAALVRAARFQADRWVLPIVRSYADPPADERLLEDARSLRRSLGFEVAGAADE